MAEHIYTIIEPTEKDSVRYIQFPIEISGKNVESFTVPMSEFELGETGTNRINGILTYYMKFKIIK